MAQRERPDGGEATLAKSNTGTYVLIALFALVLVGGAVFALTKPPGQTVAEALAPKASDIGLGNPTAPIKVIEYASFDCPHCADFAINVLPKIKTDYIDTGKVYYVMRDSPRSDLSAVAAMVARCAAKDRYYEFSEMLYRNQEKWLGQGVTDQKGALLQLFTDAGVSNQQMQACVTQPELDKVAAIQLEAVRTLRLQGVPQIWINGEEFTAARSFESFDARFKQILAQPAPQAPASP
jgi:protein-disulfide isomerase